jgi:CheY-like chemotaxis protein
MSAQKILIVEDEPAVLQVLQRLLMDEGYQVSTAQNGKEGLEKVSDPSGPPNLILADIMMPQMDGFELCRQVRMQERTRTIPFIFITAKTSPRDRAKAYGLGVQRFLTKPFTRQQVFGAVTLAFSDASRRAQLERKLPLSGKLTKISVCFLIELFFFRHWKGKIKLSREDQEGVIVFNCGEISAASLGTLSKEEALEKMVSWEDGIFMIEREG